MNYESPVVEVVGPASDLIQNYAGPRYDGDGYTFSLDTISSQIEAD